MLILMDCRPLQNAGASSEANWFIITCIKELTAQHGVEWLFLLEQGSGDLSLPGGRQVSRKALRGRLGHRLWYGWVIPRVARKYKADLIMTSEGALGRAAGTLEKRTEKRREGWCRWGMANGELRLSYGGEGGMVVTAPLAPDERVRALLPEERERVKEKIAGGREYFFANVIGMEASKVMDLLKAFSLFKKRQLSNMKLVLAGVGSIDKLDSYKYREDVCLYLEGTKEQMEGAYAVMHMPGGNDPGIAVLNAWRARVPVIMMAGGQATAGAGVSADRQGEETEAVLRVPVGDITSLAEALKSLYKDEGFRNALIGKGELGVEGLCVRESAKMIWGLVGRRTAGSFGYEN